MLTLASYITLIRLFLSPVVAYYIHLQCWLMAVIIFLLAAITDLFDGFVARKFGQTTDLGQLLDPIADKCLIMTTLYSLLFHIDITFWSGLIIYFLFAKEMILLVVGAWLKLQYNFFIKPSVLSRAASIAEMIVIIFLFLCLIMYGYVPGNILIIVLISNLFLSVWLLVRYCCIIYRQLLTPF